jgi:hypothetical protein
VISRSEANRRLAQAEDLHATTTPTGSVVEAALPRTAEALAQGAVGPGHVEMIQKMLGSMKHLEAEQLAWAEEILVAQAAQDDPATLGRFAGRIREWTVKLVNDTPYFTPPAYVDPQQRVRRNTLHRQ